MRKTIITLLALVVANISLAQVNKSFAVLDAQTYQLFFQGKYSELNSLGDSMISNGIDYYYLRMRLGIAAFNKKRYGRAIKHFSKAMEFSSADPIVPEYIFYSYVYSGRETEALLFRNKLPLHQQSGYVKEKSLTGVRDYGLELSYLTNESTNKIISPLLQNEYTEFVENALNIKVYIDSRSKKGAFWGLAYSNYRKQGVIYSQTYPSGGALNFAQHQLYSKLGKALANGYEVFGFAHAALYEGAPKVTQTWGGRSQMQTNYESDFLLGLGIAKRTALLGIQLNASYSNLVGTNQGRAEALLTVYPFQNLNLYTTTQGMYQFYSSWGKGYHISQVAGFKALKFMWVELGASTSNIPLYATNAGQQLNNSFQTPALSMFGQLSFYSKTGFNAHISAFRNTNYMYTWNLSSGTKSNKTENILNGFSISIGIKL